MAIIDLSTALVLGAQCGWGFNTYDRADAADDGTIQDVIGGEPRWTLQLVQPQGLFRADAGRWQALLASLRGGVNRLKAWDPAKPAPLGTLRGSPTLSGAVAKGATALPVAGSGTLEPGDMLQVGTGYGTSQLFMVTAAGVGGGSISVFPPARLAFASGTAITWDKPCSYFRGMSVSSTWQGSPAGGGIVQGMSLNALEAWV